MRRCEREEFLQGMNFFFISFGFLVPCTHYLLYVKVKSQTMEIFVWLFFFLDRQQFCTW